MNFLQQWSSSLDAATSYTFFSECGRALVRSWWSFAATGLVLSCVYIIARLAPAAETFFIGWIMALPVPFVAVLASPLYFPFLLFSASPQRPVYSVFHLVVHGALFYVSVCGILGGLVYAFCAVEQHAVIAMLAILTLITAPYLVWYSFLAPVAAVAYVYEPISRMKKREFWKHVLAVTTGELPFIFLLLVYAAPLAVLIYNLPSLMVRTGMITRQVSQYVLHAASIMYWQLAWVAFIVFYHLRKQRYIVSRQEGESSD